MDGWLFDQGPSSGEDVSIQLWGRDCYFDVSPDDAQEPWVPSVVDAREEIEARKGGDGLLESIYEAKKWIDIEFGVSCLVSGTCSLATPGRTCPRSASWANNIFRSFRMLCDQSKEVCIFRKVGCRVDVAVTPL